MEIHSLSTGRPRVSHVVVDPQSSTHIIKFPFPISTADTTQAVCKSSNTVKYDPSLVCKDKQAPDTTSSIDRFYPHPRHPNFTEQNTTASPERLDDKDSHLSRRDIASRRSEKESPRPSRHSEYDRALRSWLQEDISDGPWCPQKSCHAGPLEAEGHQMRGLRDRY